MILYALFHIKKKDISLFLYKVYQKTISNGGEARRELGWGAMSGYLFNETNPRHKDWTLQNLSSEHQGLAWILRLVNPEYD